jgi:hypothetical protein
MRETNKTREAVNPIITGMDREGQRKALAKQNVTQSKEMK